ncbi:MAG: prolipoprotein diacylglyceryl transferase [Patescibacteria group bacterium]|jgi:phosphatidylglycerol:prolipoprotein diacylglycerol transferase
MFPVILAIGPITISSLGLFLTLAFFFGGFSVWRRAKEEHYEDDDIFDVIFLSFFGGIVGARLLHIFLNFPDFRFYLSRWFSLAYSNQFSWLGFLIGMMYVLFLLAKKRKWKFYEFADISVLGLISAQILLLIGQFLDGSYVGKQTGLPWGLEFPGLEGKRHPLPLYEIGILLVIYFLIKWLDKRYRLFSWYQNNRGEANPGFLWLTYLAIFSVSQFLIDYVSIRTTVFWIFSSYQIFLFFFILYIWLSFWVQAGNKISLPFQKKTSTAKSETSPEPIRPPIAELKPRARERRFSRARAGKDVANL